MAYLRSLDRQRCSCGKPSHVELFNYRNASLGCFCKTCGRLQLAAQAARERASPAKPELTKSNPERKIE